MTPTRRGFLGIITMAPVAAAVFGDAGKETPFDRLLPEYHPELSIDVETPLDVAASRTVPPATWLRLMFKGIDHRLRDLDLRVVGPPDHMRLGETWGGGTFTSQPYLGLNNIRMKGNQIVYDPVEFEKLVDQYAAHVRAANVRYIGCLELPMGTAYSGRKTNRRLSVRFVTIYNIQQNELVGRVDVLGSPA